MLDGFLRSGRGRTSRAVWVPPGGGGGALPTGAGANEPVGMTQVFSQPFTAMPPNLPTQDAHGFTVNSGQSRLSIMTDGVNSWLRGTIPAAHCHSGSSVWQFFAAGATAGPQTSVVAVNPWPINTGKFYSRQWLRFSPNYRMDGSVSSKAWSPRHTQAASTNNFLSYHRGNTATAATTTPVGQEEQMKHRWTTQTGGAVGTFDVNQSGPARFQSNNATWHDYEFLMVPGTPGGSDWSLFFWVDGVLGHSPTGVAVNNVGDSNHVGELNVFHQFNPTVNPPCTLLNTTDGSGLPGTEWQDQWMDYGYWYASVEPV